MSFNHTQFSTSTPHGMLRRAAMALCYSVVAIVILAARLSAQADPDSVKLRNDCRFAEQVLSTGHPDPHRADALATIARCGPSAFLVIADVWERGTLDSTDVAMLATSTRTYPSDVLAQRLLQVAGSSSQTRIVRLYAMSVLVTFMDEGRFIAPEHLIGPKVYAFDRLDHSIPQTGRELLTISVRDRLISLSEQLKSSDPDPVIRTAADHLLQNLR